MKRSEVYRFRLTPGERDRLEQETAERGLTSKADRIREALGWEGRASNPAPPAAVAAVIAEPPADAPSADPAREPGKAGIEELAKRIYGKEGVPMAAARQRAKERLKTGGQSA